MIIKEYRVHLPISVEEYQVAQLWSVAQASKNETGGGEGIEVLRNEPFENEQYGKGQYTHKIYHLQSKVPMLLRLLAPKGALEIHEEAWNAYPYCRTVVTNPDYMKDGFHICIESWHKPDRGTVNNVHNLSRNKWDRTDVVDINIADECDPRDYNREEDPTIFRSEKSGRGPLAKGWVNTCEPTMCAYKLVTCEFKWFGFQNKVEGIIHKFEKRIFTKFHRQLFCWMDNWFGLTIEDIRAIEAETKMELDEQRKLAGVRGTKETD